MGAAIASTVSALRDMRNTPSRIGLTDLARSKAWQNDLAEKGIVEITDRNETTAYLVSSEELKTMLDEFDALEAEVEQLRIEAIFKARAARTDWKSGTELAKGAKTALKSMQTN